MSNQQAEFVHLLEKVTDSYRDSDDGESLAKKVCERLRQEFIAPRTRKAAVFLGLTNLDDNRYRDLLFFPGEWEAENFYPKLIRCGSELQSCCISLLFLIYRHDWLLLSAFVRGKGLEALSDLLHDKNIYIRGQVLEIFLDITAGREGVFDWWTVPTTVPERKMHLEMRSLDECEHFLPGLVFNSKADFPGASMNSLRLLAFWLSWIRLRHTAHEDLALSRPLLAAIQEWGTEEHPPEHIKQLRTQMFEDFSRVQAFESSCLYSVRGILKGEIPVEETENIDEPAEKCTTAKRNMVTSNSPLKSFVESEETIIKENPTAQPFHHALDLKEAGNRAFAKGDFDDAITLYQNSLEALHNEETDKITATPKAFADIVEPGQDGCFDISNDETHLKGILEYQESSKLICEKFHHLRAVLYANKAVSYLKKFEKECSLLKNTVGEEQQKSREAELQDSILKLGLEESESAIDEDPTYLKGYFRNAQLLSALGLREQAIARIESTRKLAMAKGGLTASTAELNGLDQLLAQLMSSKAATLSITGLMPPGLPKQEKQALIMQQLLDRKEYNKKLDSCKDVLLETTVPNFSNKEDESFAGPMEKLSHLLLKAEEGTKTQQASKKQLGAKTKLAKENNAAGSKAKKKSHKRSRQEMNLFQHLESIPQNALGELVDLFAFILRPPNPKTLSIPGIFGENLSNELISKILQAFTASLTSLKEQCETTKWQEVLADAVEVIFCLTQCTRFSLISSGLTQEEKKFIKWLLYDYECCSFEDLNKPRQTPFIKLNVPEIKTAYGID